MRSIGAEFIAQLESGYLTPFTLFEFTDGSSWYRYTNFDVSITTATDSTTENTYTPIGYDIESIQYSIGNIVDEANISIDNLNQVMTLFFAGGVMQSQQAKIWVGVLDTDGLVIDVLNLFNGEIDSFSLGEDKLTLKLGSYFSKWSHKSISRHGSSCRWRVFKGTECQYAGAETACDRRYETCVGYANTVNFGGFRFLPDLEEKVLWWGPTPSEYRKE